MVLTLDFVTDPAHSMLVFDIDGTLAPIADRPEDVVVSPETLALLRQLVDSYGLVACVTGRSLEVARKLVSTPGVWFAACHGIQIAAPTGEESVDERASSAREQLDLAVTLAQTVGWRYEDKGFVVALHFRHAASPELTARQMREQVTTVLDPMLIELTDARLALEIRPRGARTKADAVKYLVAGAAVEIEGIIVVGDDHTDIAAFEGAAETGLPTIRVAVDSDEVPAALLATADVVLPSQAAVQDLLAWLVSYATAPSAAR